MVKFCYFCGVYYIFLIYENIMAKTKSKNQNFGKKMSDEQKKRMSISIKTKKKVSCYSLENQFIATYESITSAAREIKGSHRHIQKCCKGKNKTAYGLIWKYSD